LHCGAGITRVLFRIISVLKNESDTAVLGLKRMNRKPLFARRVREIRQDPYGGDGAKSLAAAINIPEPTWVNFERSVTMPADALFALLEITGADRY
jgi:hypothetical protein